MATPECEDTSILKSAQADTLIAQAKAGSVAAQQRLIEEAMHFLHPAIMAMLHEQHRRGLYVTDTCNRGGPHLMETIADDAWALTHTTCVAMMQNLHSFRGRSALGKPVRFSTWLYAIAQNQMRSTLRQRRRDCRRRHDESQMPYDTPAVWEKIMADTIAAPDEGILKEVDRQLLERALDEAPLTAEQKQAVVMFYVLGYKQRRIAQLTGVQVGTVKKRIFDGLRKLHAYMMAGMDEPQKKGGRAGGS